MNWQYLKYFEVVAHEEHFTRAAEALHMTQSALSKSISNLESELGVALFESTGRGVRLTKYGQIFYNHVSSATAEVEKGIEKLHDMVGAQGGTVTFATIFTMGAFFIPSLIRGFRDQNPNIKLNLYQKSTSDILDDVLRGEADLGFCGEFPRERKYADIECEPVQNEELLLAVPLSHPLAKRTTPVEFSEIKDEDFIGYTGNTGIIHSIRQTLEQAGINPELKFVYAAAEDNTVASLVREGLGIAFLADNPLVIKDGLHFLHVKNPYLSRTLYMIWRKGKYLSPAARTFKYYVLSRTNL